MPKQAATQENEFITDLGELNPKQIEFFNSKAKFTCYGGAKGGGKTHALRVMEVTLAATYSGIRILSLRATFDDVRQNHIEPTIAMLSPEIFSYNGSTHKLTFCNGSYIQYGNWESSAISENKYQGQEYDVIFIDEATQFTERMFRHLAGCLRGTSKTSAMPKDFRRRMYLTCNPGGIGHFWVKRLFIDRKFHIDKDNPEKTERPEDYNFIFARAEDNVKNLEENPDYLETISQMSNSDAMRYGDWNSISGCYFSNFDPDIHTIPPFIIPKHWQLYRSFDYGFDMFACFWWAVDEDGRLWCYRSFEKERMLPQEAAAQMLAHTMPNEEIRITYAPPDMWNKQKDTGRTIRDVFFANGVPIVKADNNRVQSHTLMRSLLKPMPLSDRAVIKMLGGPKKAPTMLPGLMFFSDIGNCLEDIQCIQADEKNPEDCAKEPHDITHTVDAIRYFCISRAIPAEKKAKPVIKDPFYDFKDDEEDDTLGGEPSMEYLNYGCG